MDETKRFRAGQERMSLKGTDKEYIFFAPLLKFDSDHNVKQDFLPTGGVVYVLLAEDWDGLSLIDVLNMGVTNQFINDLPFQYVYIGETDDLFNELTNHPKSSCTTHYKTIICLWLRENDKDERIRIINDIKGKYQFLCD